MIPLRLTVHPIYGTIYHDGEFVQRGAVLGLSVDSKEVVIAPISGWVRVSQATEVSPHLEEGLGIEIWQQLIEDDASDPPPSVH